MLKIGTKLSLGIGALVMLCVLIGIVSYMQTRAVHEKLENVTQVREPLSAAVAGLESNLVQTAFATMGYFATGDDKLREAYLKNRDEFALWDRNKASYPAVRAGVGLWPGLERKYRRLDSLALDHFQLKDRQVSLLEELLKNLEATERLLTDRIQTSIKADDPLAYRRLQAVLEMQIQLNASSKGVDNFLLTGRPEFINRYRDAVARFYRFLSVYRVVIISQEEKSWAADLDNRAKLLVDLADQVFTLQQKRSALVVDFMKLYRELGSIVSDHLQVQIDTGLAVAKEDLLETGKAANYRVLGVLMISLVFGVGGGIAITRNITRPLKHLVSVMHAVAQGDWQQRVTLTTSDEFRSLGDAFNHMTGELVRANSELLTENAVRRKTEEDLRESELRFRTIFQDAPIGIALADGEGQLLQTNSALQEMLNCPAEELRGQTLDALQSLNGTGFGHSAHTENRFRLESSCRCPDGRMAILNMNVSHVQTSPGEAARTIVMVEDVTTRRATERQMRMLAHTLTSMNEGVVITNPERQIISVNRAFERTYGFAAEEILGEHINRLWTGVADGPSGDEVFSIDRSRGWTGEIMQMRNNGGQFLALLSTSVVFDEEGRPIAVVGISRDITEQKRLRQQLEEAERSRVAGLRAFAIAVQGAQEEERARIARELHDDLCQRLTGMKFRVEAAEGDVTPGNKRVIRQLRDFTQELDRSISEVRRISSNLRPSALDDFGLVPALRLLCNDLQKRHGVLTTLTVEGGVPERVEADVEIALYRIAQEALANAARHAAASSIEVHLAAPVMAMQLAIRDDGRGFTEEDTRRAKKAGHGAGLTIMRERCELLGGVFEMSSGVGKGTTISIVIPRAMRETDAQDTDSDRG